jgi:uncharacterized coiled-coil protein SlyX
MLMRLIAISRKHALVTCAVALVLLGLNVQVVRAQVAASADSAQLQGALNASDVTPKSPAENSGSYKKPATTEEKLNALEQMLEQQNQRLNQLQQTIAEQQETIRLLSSKLDREETRPPTSAVATQPQPVQATSVDDRVKKLEGRVAEIGAIKISGDVRIRAESFFGLSNNLANGDNPAILGNELSPRHRMRLRARLQMRGSISDEFDWGLRYR